MVIDKPTSYFVEIIVAFSKLEMHVFSIFKAVYDAIKKVR